MNPRRKKRLAAVTASVAGLAIAIGLMLYALNQNIDLFLVPSEVINGKEGIKPQVGQRIKVGGMVVEGSVSRDPESLDVIFKLTDIGPLVTVNFQGILPDLFREGQGIIVTGTYAGEGLVNADEVLAKHDEEYMPPEMAEKLKGIKHVKPDNSGAY